MFERTEIEGYIYKGFVEHYYKKPTWADANHDVLSRKMRGEYAFRQVLTPKLSKTMAST